MTTTPQGEPSPEREPQAAPEREPQAAPDPALDFLTALLPANSQVRTRAFTSLLRALTAPGPGA